MQGHEKKIQYFRGLISQSRKDMALGDIDRKRSNWANLDELVVIIERWCQTVGIENRTETYRSNPTDRNRNRQIRRFLYKHLNFPSEFAHVYDSSNGSFHLRRPVRTIFDTKVTLVVRVLTIFQYRIAGYIHVWDDGRPYFLNFEDLNGATIARMLRAPTWSDYQWHLDADAIDSSTNHDLAKTILAIERYWQHGATVQ